MNPAIAMAMGSGGVVNIYSDDVFSVYTYTGNGTSQSINNGINLSGSGGMVLLKCRSSAFDVTIHDTARGSTKLLASNTTAAEGTSGQYITSFNSNGFSLGSNVPNTNAQRFVSYAFRKASNFFDVVTYTGNGSASVNIPHNLGTSPGMIIVKNRSTGAWAVYHTSVGTSNYLVLNTTAASVSSADYFSSVSPTTFMVGSASGLNTNTASYIAYVFGHNTASDGLIQCGTFTCDGSGNASVTSLGWEPQLLLVKASSTTGDWIMLDIIRGFDTNTADAKVLANSNAVETTADHGNPTATGFNFKGGTASATYIFVAIRRSNKPPTSGTSVFAAGVRTGTGSNTSSSAAGFSTDLIITKKRSSTTLTAASFVDRVRGKTIHLDASSSAAEVTTADTITAMDSSISISIGADATTSAFNTSGHTYIDYFLKRAAGVFDIVCDTGTGSAHTIAHNLVAIPELILRKGRSGGTQWEVYCSAIANTEKLVVNSTAAKATDTTAWSSTTPTASVFTVGTGANVNTNTATYVSYLFASKTGISKVGSYTGNGTSLNIDCGFAAGARFVMIKRSDSTGDWIIFDTVRGIIAGNDPWFALNTTAAEVTTDDSIDPYSLGFTVNQVAATNVNVSSGNYIFLAIA